MAVKSKRGVFYPWGENTRGNHQNKKKIFNQELGSQGRLLLWVYTLFMFSEALSGTFVNVYLWKENNSYSVIGWYNISFFVAMQVTFMVAGKWVKVYNKMSCLRTGIAIAATFYLLVLLLGNRATSLIIPLGFLQGIGQGCFWCSFNIAVFEITNKENRDKFNGLSGVFGSLVGMAAPLASGYTIARMSGFTGYTVVFSVSLGIYIAGVILSFFLEKRESGGSYSIAETFQIFSRSKTWKRIFLAMIGQGFNESVFNFLVGLLVYIATKNEWKLGVYTFITSAVAFISFYIVGKLIRTSWRSRGLLLGTILMSISTLPLFLQLNYKTLLIMGIGVSLFSPLFYIPAVSIVFDAIGKDEDSAKWKVESIIIRESGLNVGRLLSIALFLIIIAWRDDALILSILLLVINLALMITWFFLSKVRL